MQPINRLERPVPQILLSIALILVSCNLRAVAMAGITGYQKTISPLLGIHCAYAHATGSESCSAYAKRVIGENGFYKGMIMADARFHACASVVKGAGI